MKLLLVEDEPRAAELLSKGLREQGYAVDLSAGGREALYRASITDYDAIVLDVMLPGVDGFEVCRRIRGSGAHTPILMLTAKDAVEARIEGLDSGADDYLTKPFDFGELLARLRAVIRRGRLPVMPAVMTFGNLRVDLRARQAHRLDQLLRLTSREFSLLEFLVLHAGQVVGRGEIAEHVWDAPFESMSNVIDVMVQRLRRKIDDPQGASCIVTRRGEGYMFSAAERVSDEGMKLSIRARLTLWYCSIVVAVLVTGAVAGSFLQSRLSLQRLDDDLVRAMATLQGVMRTEFTEGLTLEEAAEEASVEVVVPDRTLMLARPDGAVLHVWGLPLPEGFVPAIGAQPAVVTIDTPSGGLRTLSQEVEHAGHHYRAAVLAPLEPLFAQHNEMVRAMSMGVALALLVAAVGGLLIGRQTLRPLTLMAEQARGVDERDPRARLIAPPVDDELGRLAASFNGLLDRLASALNAQRQFMADASHQLRTPVSIVRTASQVTLTRDGRTADEYREALTIIGEQSARLSRLVDDMFLLSRAEAQGVPLRREFLHFDEVVADSARAARVLADQRNVAVTIDGAEEVGLAGDDALLRQMVGNLLDNAIRHARPDGTVGMHLDRSDGLAVLRLTNDGTGIETADRDRIFDRFVRAGESSGAGLGLPIARWIAEAHGGTLQLAESRPGCTTFVVSLPVH